MIDLHTHILYEIDDGSRSFLESVVILKNLARLGFKAVVCTPHYITGSKFQANNQQKYEQLKLLREVNEKENLHLHLYLGNEVYINSEIEDLLKKGEIFPINHSRYLLVEFPVSRVMDDLFTILFYLRNSGFVPIIAHPERYLYLQEKNDFIQKILDMGCLFQGNFSCVLGKYGEHAKKMFFYFLKNNYYHFLATDVHHETDILFKKFAKVRKIIVKEIGEESFRNLTYVNPLKVIRDEKIEVFRKET